VKESSLIPIHTMTGPTDDNLSSTRRQALIHRTTQLFESNDQPSTKDIRQLHQDLINTLNTQQSPEDFKISQFRLEKLPLDYLLQLSELCHCLQLTCQHLPNVSDTLAQVQWLGRLLQEKYFIYTLQELPVKETIVISVDREQLVLEEEELWQMAKTPIPTGSSTLTARYGASMMVEMNHVGIIRSRESDSEWCWCIDTKTKVTYKSPHLRLLSLRSCKGGVEDISLFVGQEGARWLALVHECQRRLEHLEKLEGQVEGLWSEKEYKERLREMEEWKRECFGIDSQD